jgi:hypothetical protein
MDLASEAGTLTMGLDAAETIQAAKLRRIVKGPHRA